MNNGFYWLCVFVFWVEFLCVCVCVLRQEKIGKDERGKRGEIGGKGGIGELLGFLFFASKGKKLQGHKGGMVELKDL